MWSFTYAGKKKKQINISANKKKLAQKIAELQCFKELHLSTKPSNMEIII